METNLRPLSLGEILDRTAQLYRSNFLLFAGISSFYAGVVMVLSLLQIGAKQAATALHSTQGTIWVTVIGILVLWLAIFAFGGISVAANNRAVGWVNLGQPATIGSAYSSVLAKAGRYLWLMTITYFIVFLPCALLYGGYAALLFVYVRPKGLLSPNAAPADTQALVVFGVASLIFVVLLLIAIAYAIVMAMRYSLAVPACVVENLKARAAIRRSIELSKGSRGRIFMLGLLATIIQLGLTLITQGFFVAMGIKHHGVLPVWVQVVQQIVAFFTNTLVGPIYATGLTLFYYDQRVRKEGYDIEWMMQAAGMIPTAPQVEAGTAPGAVASPEPENLHG
jgi:hypothetical protein